MNKALKRIKFVAKFWKFLPFLKDYFLSNEVRIQQKVLPVLLLIGYIALPFDLIPDFLSIFGVTDDILIGTFILQRIIKNAPESIKGKYELTKL
ncbi:YkvA family protein [Cytobacillus sp. FJAT-54145]|uniref:YkvA family protein n=1 Tax=Cytobacillus spartinae TaxID=3299023 RepID=A0ABW6K5T9_9BACI